jgi:hypothetical protein
VKLPHRAEKCLKILDDIESSIDYYSGGNKLHIKDFKVLRSYIAEISESKKLSEIKVAVKIKKEKNDSDS